MTASQWSSWSAWLTMGGYGLYVWGALGMSLLLPALEWVALWRRRRAALAAAAQHGAWERDETAA